MANRKRLKPSSAAVPSRRRRHLLRWGAAGALGSIGAVALARYESNTRELHDLSVIGSAGPVVVQVHDPSCPSCRRLKSATETALRSFPDIHYRIADLTTDVGRSFGEAHRAGKVTLLLFDKRGRRVGIVEGVTPVEELQAILLERLAG